MPLAVVAGVYVALFAYYLQRTIIVEPYWDMYSHVLRYLQFQQDGAWWAYLWDPHVQHRHLWMRLLTALDVEVFRGIAYPFIVAAASCLGGTAWLLWRETRRIQPAEVATTVGIFVVMCLLTAVAAVICAIPMDSVYPQALFFSVLALVLFDGAHDFAGFNRWSQWRRTAAVLAAAGAAFGSGATLPLWPILIWMAWRAGAGATWIAAIATAGVIFITVYVLGLPLRDQAAAPSIADGGILAQLLRMGDYLLAYLGLPWTRAEALAIPGRAVGAAFLGAGCYAVVRYGLLLRSVTRLERIAVALVLFSLATAFLAAVGRANLADTRVPVRYSLFIAPLHVGLLWLATPYLIRQWQIDERRRLFRRLALGAASILLVQQIVAGQTAVATTDAMRASIRRFMAGKTEPGMERVVFDNLDQARQSWTAIRDAGLYTGR
jgi:hypothetical protein